MTMRTIVVGLGIQGNKRRLFSGSDFKFSVDPFINEADFKDLKQVDFTTFDSALLCIPDQIKLAYVKELIAQGKNVLIEKPFNITIEETKEIEEIARKNDVTVYVAYNHRFEPHWVTTNNLLKEKHIGEIYKVNLFYGNGTVELVRNSKWRDQGLGVIPDLASHLFDLVDFWFGLENYNLEIISANKFENQSFDNAVLRLVGKPEVILEVSLLSWRNNFKAELIGSEGSIHLESLCKWGPTSLTVRNRMRPSGRPNEKISIITSPDPTWESEYLHFKSLIKSKNPGNLNSNLKVSLLFEKLNGII